MANLTLRVLSRAGDTTKNAPLTNAEIDQNFINLDADLDLKANIDSPALTGTPTAPTAPGGTNTTQIATTQFVNTAIATGNAATATKLQTARTITIGNTSKSVDGSANVSWSLADIGAAATNGTGATGTWDISVSGNAATATKLQTARTITIGNTGKSFDGAANVSWSLAEIGAATATHTHAISDVTGLQAALDGGYRIKNIRTLSTVGSGTFTPTPGTKAMMVWVLGGGGSGAYSTDGAGGGGGGGGGCAFAFITQVAGSYNYTVGAGGALAAQGAGGNDGMNSSFSTPSGSFSIIGGGGYRGRTSANWGYRFGGYGGYGSITSSSSEISASITYPGQAGLGGYNSGADGSAGVAGGGNHLFCNSDRVTHYQAEVSPPPGCGGNGNLGASNYTPAKGGNGFILIWEFV